MDGNGWIKLHRDIKTHWIFNDPEYLKAWLTILLTVNFEPKKIVMQHDLTYCGRGQSILSLNSWAELFGKKWTIQRVRTFFKLLQNDNMIVSEGLKYSTRITVCKYDVYQNIQQTENILITSTKEREEIKNNISVSFETFRRSFPGTKRGLKIELANFLKKNKPEIVNQLLPALEKEKKHREILLAKKEFIPNWKDLSTWINKKCWEQEFSDQKNEAIKLIKPENY